MHLSVTHQVCSDTERLQILAQLQKVYPDRDINGIYSHYSRIASLLTSTDQSDPPSSSKPVRNPPQKLLRTKRKIRTRKGVGEPLKCSIRICNPTMVQSKTTMVRGFVLTLPLMKMPKHRPFADNLRGCPKKSGDPHPKCH